MRRRLAWIAAWALAVAAPVLYLAAPGDLTWWVAALLLVPLVLLAAMRDEDRGGASGSEGGTSGAWAPVLGAASSVHLSPTVGLNVDLVEQPPARSTVRPTVGLNVDLVTRRGRARCPGRDRSPHRRC
jgi:hypothetical protein